MRTNSSLIHLEYNGMHFKIMYKELQGKCINIFKQTPEFSKEWTM